MSAWNTFTTAISGLPAFGKRATGGAQGLSDEELRKEAALRDTVKNALAGVDAELDSNPLTRAAKNATKQSADLLLRAAVNLNNKVISPYITRPAATLGLLTDIDSPLYKKGKYEEGFQFKDIKDAYARSAKVSTFQALTKSELTPIAMLSSAILPSGGIDMNKVDLWNDESIKENFVDNTVGRWFTGVGDFFVGNKVLGVAGKLTGAAVKAGAKPAGLYTKGKTVEEFAADAETGILWSKTNGTAGTQTVAGSHMTTLAETKDWGVVEDLVTKYSTNEKLIPLIRDASDADVVKDIILADKGNLAALERLSATSSDKLFVLGNVQGQLANQFIQTGRVALPEGAAVPRLQKAFDDAINADPQFVKLRDAFFDENYSLTVGGKAYMPLEPKIGTGAFIKGQEKVRGAKTAIGTRFADAPESFKGFAETTLGSTTTGLAMRLVRLVGRGTEALPTGYVSFSGMRPLQARTELNGFLNNMKVFRDGAAQIETSPGVFQKVADVRSNFENIYMSTLGKGPGAQMEALKEIDTQVGRILGYQLGMSTAEIDNIVTTFQGNVSRGIQSVQQNGFGIGHDGSAILVQPQTVRQLAESYRFTPWDDIEKQIELTYGGGKVKVENLKEGGQEFLRNLNRYWTFDVLARPAYALKQSIFEPVISTGLAYGLDFVRNDVIRAYGYGAMNLRNWAKGVKVSAANRKEYAAVNKVVTDKSKQYQKAVEIKETAEASVKDLLENASPATKSQHLSAAKKELLAAERLLDKIELDLRAAVVPYGVKAAVPSIVTLERRVKFLEANPGITTKSGEIADAKIAIANYRDAINKLATNKKVILDNEKAVDAAYANIENALSELGDAVKNQADVFGKSAEFKRRYYGKAAQGRVIDGEYVEFDSFIEDPTTPDTNYFTAAVRGEVQNARTADINWLGEQSIGVRKSAIQRKIPLAKIGVADETYFEELAFLANRQYRGDDLMDLILKEAPMSEIQKWALTDTGRAYLRQFDVYDVNEIPSYLADKVALVQRTFPSYEARAAIVKGEVSSQQLKTLLAPYIDELYDITPANHNYVGSSFGKSQLSKLNTAVNETMARAFRGLSAFENPIRYAAFDKVAIDAVARRVEYLQSQGVKMTPERINALRQAAGREALQDVEKTLYTINNPNRFINSLRLITAFPAANANAFLRYARLAAKSPQRATGFMYNYGRTFQTFGVDENGNPTNDIDKITHLIVPGTGDMNIGPRGEGIALSSQSLGFLLNRPSPSFISSYSVGKMMQTFPKTEKQVEEFLTVGGTNYYKVLYPFGPSTSLVDAFRPPWANALYNAVVGPEGKQDYLSSWKSVYNYHAMLVEMGVQKDIPTDDQIRQEVKGLWLAKFFSSWSSPFAGIPYKVDTNPMGLTSGLYYKLIEKYKAQKMSNQEARDAAGEEMLSLLGPKFMLDRITFTGSNKNINIPNTYEAYARVFEDNKDLVGRLANIEPGEIGLIGLLTADLDRDPAEQSGNVLKLLASGDLTVPGTSKRVNELKLTPKEIETERLKQRTWSQYTAVKEALEAKITDGQSLRGHPELKAVLDKAVDGPLREMSQAWYDEFQFAASGDTSYKYARALFEITNDKKFMSSSGKNTFWQDAQFFLKARSLVTQVYQGLPDYDPRKARVKDAYNAWVAQNASQWDSNLKTIVTRYFDNDNLKAVN
jgi:hypothetical protein